MDINIRPAHEQEREQIAHFMAQKNSQSSQHCLHTALTPEGILRQMAGFDFPLEESFWVAISPQGIVGCLGLDISLVHGRGWLHGPFAEDQHWTQIAASLLQASLQGISPFVRTLNNFLPTTHTQGQKLMRDFHFQEEEISHFIYKMQNPGSQMRPLPQGLLAGPHWQPALMTELENWLQSHKGQGRDLQLEFQDMVDLELAGEGRTYVMMKDLHPAGLIFVSTDVSAEPEESEGQIDLLLAKDDEMRRSLLQAGLHWIFQERQLPTATLSLSIPPSQNQDKGRQFFEAAGFRLQYEGKTFEARL